MYVSPSFADEKLYAVTDQRHIYVLNATDGQKLGFFSTGSNSWSAATIYEGRVYVGNNDWNVYCLADYPALISDITLSLSNTAVVSGEVVTGFGQLVPGKSNATVVLSFARPDGSTNSMQTFTSDKGTFTFTFTPSEMGSWSVNAQWNADKSYYASATSPTLVLTVNGIPQPSPSPTESPSPSVSSVAPTPFEEKEVAGVPIVYIYIVFILFLVTVITVAAYVYLKRIHH